MNVFILYVHMSGIIYDGRTIFQNSGVNLCSFNLRWETEIYLHLLHFFIFCRKNKQRAILFLLKFGVYKIRIEDTGSSIRFLQTSNKAIPKLERSAESNYKSIHINKRLYIQRRIFKDHNKILVWWGTKGVVSLAYRLSWPVSHNRTIDSTILSYHSQYQISLYKAFIKCTSGYYHISRSQLQCYSWLYLRLCVLSGLRLAQCIESLGFQFQVF